MLKNIILILILSYVGYGLMLFFSQNRLMYYPDNTDFNSCKGFEDSQKLNLDGTRVYYKKNSADLIVFYHGNAGSACDRSFIKDEFNKLGYSYIFVEYAGYSDDKRKPSKKLIIKDAENVNEFIKTLEYSNLAIAGESIGTGAAIYHASIINTDKIMLISTFDNLLSVAKEKFPFNFYPLKLMFRENFNNGAQAVRIKSALFIHGEKDSIIPLHHGRNLFDKIEAEDKSFVEIKGAGHNDLFDYPETFSAITNFLKK